MPGRLAATGYCSAAATMLLSGLVALTAAILPWSAVAQTCELELKNKIGPKTVNLTGSTPGVHYDNNAYKYYVEIPTHVSESDAIVVEAFSLDFQPFILARHPVDGNILKLGDPKPVITQDGVEWKWAKFELSPLSDNIAPGRQRIIISTDQITQGELVYDIYYWGCPPGQHDVPPPDDSSSGGGSYDCSKKPKDPLGIKFWKVFCE